MAGYEISQDPDSSLGISLAIDTKKTIEQEYYYIDNYINERTFFNDFVKTLYNEILKLAEEQTYPQNGNDITT